MTSAPMPPSDIAQNGPASTRVRSMTRTPARGGRARRGAVAFVARGGAVLRERVLVVATGPPVPDAFHDALADGADALAARAGAPPEEAGPVGETQDPEGEQPVEPLHPDAGAGPDAPEAHAREQKPRARLTPHPRPAEPRTRALRR